MGTEKLISGLSMELGRTPGGISTDALNERNGHARKLLTTLESHASVEHGIMANLSLTQQGQMEALKRLGTSETTPALKWLRPEIAKLQEKDERYKAQFFTVNSGLKDSSERLPIFTYLWTRFDQLDQGGRIKQFAQAAEKDQVVILSAMLEHPIEPMINEEFKVRSLDERAKRLFPTDYENFTQTELLLEFLTMSRDWLARWLALEVGVDLAVLSKALGEEIEEALKHQA